MPFPAGDRIGTEDILVIVCGSAVLRSDSLFFLKRERIEPQLLLFLVKLAITVVVSPFYSPCASNEANQSGSKRPTQHSADIFWNGFGKQRKRSSGRTEKTACKSLYEIRLFLDCDIGKGRGGIGFTGANSGCTAKENHPDFTSRCSSTHPFSMSQS